MGKHRFLLSITVVAFGVKIKVIVHVR